MQKVLNRELAHLSIFFKNICGSGLLNALFLDISGGLLLLFKPWRDREPKSQHFMGVGAFNLVKTEAYQAIGGHRRIAMHPVDDIMLGKLLKRQGYRQDCLMSDGHVSVPWYGTVPEFINGLMKNTFAVYNYRLSAVVAGILANMLIGVLPGWGLLLATGPARFLFGAVITIRLLSFVHGFRQAGFSPWQVGWSLVTPYLCIYITGKAAYLTLHNKGITCEAPTIPLPS